ncbi:MAG: hypothetical protein WDW38_003809 [Sanguina aurantia]
MRITPLRTAAPQHHQLQHLQRFTPLTSPGVRQHSDIASNSRGSPMLVAHRSTRRAAQPPHPPYLSRSQQDPRPETLIPTHSRHRSRRAWWLWALLAGALAGGGWTLYGSESGILLKEWLSSGPLGQSGMLAAFSLIFLSEIGDKTFFIAALLAMKLGRWISFIGSVAALSVMTAISVGIGAVCSQVPEALHSSIPIGELAGVALLVVFGIRTLKDGLKPEEPQSKSDAELADAETAVSAVKSAGSKSTLSSIMEVATLIFIAEWGDRSMLATIALGASQNPLGVAAGAILGHVLATAIAVVVGAIACKYVSERTINVISGALFLLFAVGTLYGMYVGVA